MPNPPDEITLWRDDNGYAQASIPQRHIHHSQTGYEFGYLGSGPADLALNILALYLPLSHQSDRHEAMKLWDNTEVSARAWSLHQQFKQDIVARIPQEAGGTITIQQVMFWLGQKLVPREEIGVSHE